VPWIIQICLYIVALVFGGFGTLVTDSARTIFSSLSNIAIWAGIATIVLLRPYMGYRLFQVSKQLRYSQSVAFFNSIFGFLYPLFAYFGELIRINRKIKLSEKGEYFLPPEHDYHKASLVFKLLLFVPLGGAVVIYLVSTISPALSTYELVPTNISVSTQLPLVTSPTAMSTSTIEPVFVNIFDDFSSVNTSVFSEGENDQAKLYFEEETFNIHLQNGNPKNWSYVFTSNSLLNDQKNIEYSIDVRVKDRTKYKNPSAKLIDIPIEYGFYLGSIEDKDFVAFTLIEWKGQIRFWGIHPREKFYGWNGSGEGEVNGSYTVLNTRHSPIPEQLSNIFGNLGDDFINIKVEKLDKVIKFYLADVLIDERHLNYFYYLPRSDYDPYDLNSYTTSLPCFQGTWEEKSGCPSRIPSIKYMKLREFGLVTMNYGLDPLIQFDNLRITTLPE
jgi:hypothetical protein